MKRVRQSVANRQKYRPDRKRRESSMASVSDLSRELEVGLNLAYELCSSGAIPSNRAGRIYKISWETMVALAGAVSVIGSPIMFVAAPPRAVAMNLWSYDTLPFMVFASPALAANDLIAIAVNGLASAVDAMPEIEASKLATLHLEDSVPLPIGSPGSPNTIAAPARSLWQTDSLGIKIRFNADWVLRDQRALAWTSVTGW
jgi:hypothetical protein